MTTIYTRLQDAIGQHAERVAIRLGEQAISYRELGTQIDQTANRLPKQVRPTSVGLLVRDPVLRIVATMSLLKAGIQILLLKPEWLMGEETDQLSIQTVITDLPPDEAKFQQHRGEFVFLPALSDDLEQVPVQSNERRECASAETTFGEPGSDVSPSNCGVEWTEKGFVAYADWLRQTLDLNAGATWGLDIDHSMHKIYSCILPALLAGNTICLLSEESDPGDLLMTLTHHGVSHACFSAPATEALLATLKESAQPLEIRYLMEFQESVSAFSPADCALLTEHSPHFRGFLRLYGRPGSTFAAAAQWITDQTSPEVTGRNIGRALPGSRIYVLDNKMRPIPADVVGNIYVGGACLAKPLSPDERFVCHPFGPAEERLYNTGDRGRTLPDGTIEITQSNPEEILIEGEMLSIAAIEKAIGSAELLNDCKVLKKKTEQLSEQLIAWVVAREACLSVEQFITSLRHLSKNLLKRLSVVNVPYIPLNDAGQPDRTQLKRTDAVDPASLRAVSDWARQSTELESYALVSHLDERGLCVDERKALPRELTETCDVPTHTAVPDSIPYNPHQPALAIGAEIQKHGYANHLGACLSQTAHRYPHKGIRLITQSGAEDFISYATLEEQASGCLAGLHRAGLRKGDRVILQIADTKEFFPVFWGCLLGGITPLALGVPPSYDQGHSLSLKLLNSWNLLDQPAIIASQSLAAAVQALKPASFRVIPAGELLTSSRTEAASQADAGAEDQAFLLLTSGSTGAPKCIPVTHQAAISHVATGQQMNDYRDDDVIVNVLPIDHITPLLTLHIRSVVTGASQIHLHPEGFADQPSVWLDTIEKYQGTHTFSPNFAYRLTAAYIAENPGQSWTLASVKCFMNAGEMINYQTTSRFLELTAPFGVRTAQFQPIYGMTELAGAISFVQQFDTRKHVFHLRKESLHDRVERLAGAYDGSFTFLGVGQPMPGTSIRILNKQNELLLEGQVGRIQVKGSTVTSGYLNNEPANQDVFVGDGWFNTGDLGFLLEGQLVMTGREKDIMIIRGINYYCYELEDAIRQTPGLLPEYVVVCPLSHHEWEEEEIAVFIAPAIDAPERIDQIVQQIKVTLATRFGIGVTRVVVVEKENFPLTESGKINRKELHTRLQQGDSKEPFSVVGSNANASVRGFNFAGKQQLTLFYTTKEQAQPREVWEALIALVRNHPHLKDRLFVQCLDAFPFTKDRINYAQLLAEAATTAQLVTDDAPGTPLEKKLAEIWKEILQVPYVGLHDHFFERSGNSLKAMQLVSRIGKRLRTHLTLRNIFQTPTIAGLAEWIKKASPITYEAILPLESRDTYEVSHAQKRLWILDQLEENAIAYNLPAVYILRGSLNQAAFEAAFQALIERHEILRTTFFSVGGELRQRIHTDTRFRIQHADIAGYPEKEKEAQRRVDEEARTPFDLIKGPLLRGGLIRTGPDEQLFLLTIHHIISDGWSMGIMIEELLSLYNAFAEGKENPLPPLAIQYKEYAVWQNRLMSGDQLAVHRDYWVKQFQDDIPVLELPLDQPRTAVKTHHGYQQRFLLDIPLSQELKKLSQRHGATLFMTLMASVKALLYRYTGQEDIVVGSAIAGRDHIDLEDQIGFYVNTLAIRTPFEGKQSFSDLLKRVKESTLNAFEHQLYPFDRLVDELNLNRDLSRSPVFDVMFEYQNKKATHQALYQSSGIRVEDYEDTVAFSKFDLTFYFDEVEEGISATIEYNTDLFAKERMVRLKNHLLQMLQSVLADDQVALDQINYLPEDEQSQLLSHFRGIKATYPRDITVPQLFEAQAARTPHATAVVLGEHALTYRELNEKANQVAHYLLAHYPLAADDLVGLLVERSPAMIVAILGVLKAGAAYVPIDLDYPPERIQYTLQDAAVKALITTEPLMLDSGLLPAEQVVILQPDGANLTDYPTANPAVRAKPDDLAYVIYTSGSTGKPKGVMVEHRNVVRLFFNEQYPFDFNASDTWTLFHSYCFDLSVWEMYGALLYGGKLVIVPKLATQIPAALADLLEKEGVTVVNQVPTVFNNLLPEVIDSGRANSLSLRYLFLGGEALMPATLKKWHERYPHCRIFNGYGPTEITVYASFKEIGPNEIAQNISNIGRAFPTLGIYLTDESGRLVPVGVKGEILIAGDGVSRGYLNRPELTAERFINNPYESGSRLYKSGDLGKLLPNGDVEYLGRKDNQIKIRGYRIEVGEIEARLRQHPGVKDAVVRVDTRGGDKSLTAIIAPSDTTAFTLKQLLKRKQNDAWLEKQPHYLPNGLAFFGQNTRETEAVYQQLFEENLYYQHGIEMGEGDVVVDVGANTGLFTLFAGFSAPGVKVYAFEHRPARFQLLEANTQLYNISVEAFPIQLTSTDQTASDFECQRLSTLIRTRELSEIHLLRIDAESQAWEVLQGIDAADMEKIKQVVITVSGHHHLDLLTNVLTLQGFSLQVERLAEQFRTEENGLRRYQIYGFRNMKARQQPPGFPQWNGRDNWTHPAELIKDIRSHCGHQLPQYMVPAQFLFVADMPVTINGKVDKKALDKIEGLEANTDRNYVLPQNEVQQKLALAWQKVLGIERIGVHDNFFEIGGNSLKIIALHHELAQVLEEPISVADLFKYNSIHALTTHLTIQQKQLAPSLDGVEV